MQVMRVWWGCKNFVKWFGVRDCLKIHTRHIELEQEVLDRALVHLLDSICAMVVGRVAMFIVISDCIPFLPPL